MVDRGEWPFPVSSDAGLGLGQVGKAAPGPVPCGPSCPCISLGQMGQLWAFSDDRRVWRSKDN